MSLKIESEVKVDSDPCVVAWDNKLFVGTEDGSIKTFDANLSPGESWTAHSVQLFALAAGGGSVYSASNDSGIKVWSANGEKLSELPRTGADVGVMHVFGKHLYAGDEAGNVVIFDNTRNNDIKAHYNLIEEVKDLWLNPPFLFTVRDLDVTVTEIKPEESKTRFTTRITMEGRAPLRTVGDRLLVMARGGNNLQLLDVSVNGTSQKLHEVKVSDKIVTSLSVSCDYAWTAGWDGHVRRWRIAGDQLEAAGELNIGSCINALVASAPNSAYAVLADARVVHISAA